MKKNGVVILVLILVGSTFFTGCVTNEKGTLLLKITDAPGDLNISEALVKISSIEVHIAAGGNNSSAGWITVVNESQQFDLIQLLNVTEILGSQTLAVGIYTQIRLDVDEALVTIDEIQYNLTIPSKTVKLVHQFVIEPESTTTLILDFDVQESIHETGNDKYIMRPTIKVIEE